MSDSRIEVHACVIPPREPHGMRDLALLAEEMGFDRFWISDQTFYSDPLLMLDYVAGRTQMALGLAVTNPYTRHPVQLARAMCTLAHLHPGRHWIFGLGTANPQHVLAPLGLKMGKAARHLRVALETIRALARGEEVSVDDPELGFSLDAVALEIDPPPRFDLYIGTRGPQVLEYAAGRAADGVMVEGQLTADGIAWARELLDAGAVRAGGKRFTGPYVAWQTAEVLGPGQTISDHAAEFAAMLMASTAPATLERMNVPHAVVDAVKSSSVSAQDLPIEELRKFVAAGTPDELGEMIDVAQVAGASAWSGVFTGEPEVAATSLRAFGEQVIAHLPR